MISSIGLTSLSVADSGTVTFSTGTKIFANISIILTAITAATFATATVGGKIIVQTTLGLTNLTLGGGTFSGPGSTSVAGYFILGLSDTGNDNSFVSSTIILNGQGTITQPVYLLLGAGGLLHVCAYSIKMNLFFAYMRTLRLLARQLSPLLPQPILEFKAEAHK